MKRISLLAVLFGALAMPAQAEENGRYVIIEQGRIVALETEETAADQEPLDTLTVSILLDTRTGRTWFLDIGTTGPPSWFPINFKAAASGVNPTPIIEKR